MAPTQVSGQGIKTDAITDVKIPADSIGNSELKDDAVGIDELSATGTASNTTFLRGDNTWGVPTDTQLTQEQVEDYVGGMLTGNTETGIAVTYDDSDGTIDFVVASQTDQNFTSDYKSKLDNIETNATADQTGGEIKSLYEAQADTNAFTDADHTKLDGIATSANNYSHPTNAGNIHIPSGGSSGQVLKYSSDGTAQWGTDNNTTYTAGTGLNLSGTEFSVTSLALTTVQEAANESAMLGLTTQEGDVVVRTDENKSYVKNAGTAGSMSDFTLLRTPTDAVLSINGNTGAISAAQIASAVEAASDSNTFTDADHTKLNAIEASATADQTGAEIKAAYEGESDTNAFTDADHTKLDGIAAGAEVNVQSDWNSSSGDNQILNKPTLVSALNDLSDVSASSPSADQIIKWNGSTWALATDGGSSAGGVSQNIIVTLSESIDGSRTDFSMSTTPATAQNLTVSINGVIQKPNAGTTISNSSEGYCVSGSTLKFATAPANGSTVFVIAQTAASGGSTDLEFNDNTKVKFGTGNDLQIQHNGNHSFIQNNTGHLHILNNVDDDDGGNIIIQAKNGENSIVCNDDAAVELYWDGSKKLETHAGGITVTGKLNFDSDNYIDCNTTANTLEIFLDGGQVGEFGSASLKLLDNKTLKLGTGNDLQIYHDGSNSYIKNGADGGNLYLQAYAENSIKCIANGEVELYYNGTKKLNTVANGIQVRGAEGAAGEFYLYADEGDDFPDIWLLKADHVASGFYIQNKNSGSWEDSIRCFGDGAVELFHDNSKKLETTSTGAEVTGKFKCSAAYNVVGAEIIGGGSGYSEPLICKTSDNTVRFTVAGNGNATASGMVVASSGFAQVDAAAHLISTSSTGSATTTYYIGNAAITTSSDQRLKENIVNTELNATTELNKVRVVDFTWNDPSDKAVNNRNARGKWTGCLAQEMVNIFPHAVNAPRPEGKEIDHDSEHMWGMEYQHLVPVLIKAIQELSAKVTALEAK